MQRLILFIWVLINLSSCHTNNTKEVSITIDSMVKIEPISYIDIIQEKFPDDSIKVKMIFDLMRNIDADTHKVMIKSWIQLIR